VACGSLELLEAEKELTRCSDELARRRQQLPWVRIDKDYVFDTDKGKQSLRDLFAGRSRFSSTTSCSARHRSKDAPTARCMRKVSTAPSSISNSAT